MEGIPCSDGGGSSNGFSLIDTLGDPVEIRGWQNCALPTDKVTCGLRAFIFLLVHFACTVFSVHCDVKKRPLPLVRHPKRQLNLSSIYLFQERLLDANFSSPRPLSSPSLANIAVPGSHSLFSGNLQHHPLKAWVRLQVFVHKTIRRVKQCIRDMWIVSSLYTWRSAIHVHGV